MADLVQAWARALDGAAYVPLPPAERRRLLARLTEQLRQAATREPFDERDGRLVGAGLVAAGFRTPESLGRTITVITTHLADFLDVPSAVAAPRLAELVEAVAAGFTMAVRDHALDEQEEVRLAAMRAHERAELALRESEARAHHLATHDLVTGLPNRAQFTQRLTRRLTDSTGAGRLAVCCLDLDRFAAVNDSLGYRAGDRLLQSVASRLRSLAAPAGWLVARLESDQFALLIESVSGEEEAGKAADRVLRALAGPFQLDDVELPMTASAGIVVSPAAGDRAGELVQAAQIALHWAKADGRARWRLFQPDRAAEDAVRYRLSADIPKGLRQGEFDLHYQPLVALDTGALVGVEALARWHHPEHGRLPAHRFIGLAEHTGMIVPLGNHLLAKACQQASSWQRRPRPPYVSVNVSAAQLHQPGFVGYLAQILDRHELDPANLQVEITEEAIVDVDNAAATLHAIVQLGVRIAVDDFGTGYSNLARLRELPFHTLKLDATFAQHATPQPTTMDEETPDRFLAAIVSFGHTLGLDVTAEGLETAAHAERMRRVGCDTGQGWHFGRPQPARHVLNDDAEPAPAAPRLRA